MVFGVPWEYLPRELGCGSGMTCWGRLWQSIHEAILRRLREYDQIAWDRACIDAACVPSPLGGEHTARNPTDRGKPGASSHANGLLADVESSNEYRLLPLLAQGTLAALYGCNPGAPWPPALAAARCRAQLHKLQKSIQSAR
jgi:hypothetical protein